MKAVEKLKGLYQRGRRYYLRKRIPQGVRLAYPSHQTHVMVSLGTADLRAAEDRYHTQVVRLNAEFDAKRQKLATEAASLRAKQIRSLSDEELAAVAEYWVRSVLLSDAWRRQQGMDDEEFEELGNNLREQRAEFGRMLAQGQTGPLFPALHLFLYLCGFDFDPPEHERKRACFAFTEAVIKALDHQLARHRGEVVPTDAVAPEALHPIEVAAAKTTWDEAFDTWKTEVRNRPDSTVISYTTPWRDLRRFCEAKGISFPADVTDQIMLDFRADMRDRERALEVDTINERLTKIRSIFQINVAYKKIRSNPAADTPRVNRSANERRPKRRLPFDIRDLKILFGSEVFTAHKRSAGQAGEASYWIPVLMYFTGARPEEIAGLALADLCYDAEHGWYLNVVDHPTPSEDVELFDLPAGHCRMLKNAPSTRKIPVAPELVDLGLLRYAEWVKEQGHKVFFPTLRKDCHGKLSGAFGKFFGRYKKELGFNDERKVLYSLRHTMKDLLEAAEVPTKELQRILGHATGDGHVTDGYGSDLPLERIVRHFKRVKFPKIPALPWEPGRGFVNLKRHRPE